MAMKAHSDLVPPAQQVVATPLVRDCILQGLHCRPVRLHLAAPLWILNGPESIAV